MLVFEKRQIVVERQRRRPRQRRRLSLFSKLDVVERQRQTLKIVKRQFCRSGSF